MDVSLACPFLGAIGLLLAWLATSIQVDRSTSRWLASVLLFPVIMFASWSAAILRGNLGYERTMPPSYSELSGQVELVGVVSDELVEIVLGRKWLGAASIILLFSFVMPIRTIFRLLQTTLDGIGRPDVGIRNLATFSVCLLPALSVGILAGIEGVAAGWCCAQVVAFIVNLRRSLPVLGVQTSEFIEVIQGTLISGVLMLASILLLKTQMPIHLVSFPGLAALIGMGAVVYGTATWMLNRTLALETFKFFRS